jgi:hypothetical protein
LQEDGCRRRVFRDRYPLPADIQLWISERGIGLHDEIHALKADAAEGSVQTISNFELRDTWQLSKKYRSIRCNVLREGPPERRAKSFSRSASDIKELLSHLLHFKAQ